MLINGTIKQFKSAIVIPPYWNIISNSLFLALSPKNICDHEYPSWYSKLVLLYANLAFLVFHSVIDLYSFISIKSPIVCAVLFVPVTLLTPPLGPFLLSFIFLVSILYSVNLDVLQNL